MAGLADWLGDTNNGLLRRSSADSDCHVVDEINLKKIVLSHRQ